jgi:hypothetical protein
VVDVQEAPAAVIVSFEDGSVSVFNESGIVWFRQFYEYTTGGDDPTKRTIESFSHTGATNVEHSETLTPAARINYGTDTAAVLLKNIRPERIVLAEIWIREVLRLSGPIGLIQAKP